MKHKRSLPIGTKIFWRDDGTPVFHEPPTTSKKMFRVLIENDRFDKEVNKERLLNLLVDMYYSQTPETADEDIKEALHIFQQVVQQVHRHDWQYVDRGNFIPPDGYLYHFICSKCGRHKRIEGKVLHDGINLTIESAEDTEPSKIIPKDKTVFKEAVEYY